MADPSSSAGEHDFAEENEGGGESTVSMSSPQIDPAVPSPISVAPPPMHPGQGRPMQMQMPTAPVPFIPGGGPAAFPVQPRPPPGSSPSMPTPFGGLTPGPGGQPMPPPFPGAPGVAGASAGNAPPGMKRPQTVIGLAPPPIGAPRPGAPGGGARVPLPSGRHAPPGSAPRAAVQGDKPPPSSGRGVRPPALPLPTPSPSPAIATKDADSTDEQLAMPEETPDSQKEDMATMAKSPEESLALFGLGIDSGLTDAARAAVVPKPGGGPGGPGRSPMSMSLNSNQPRQGSPPMPGGIQAISPLTPDQETAALPRMNPPAAGAPPHDLPVLHDRTEEEESTRAVSREEMLRGHDAVIVGEDGEGAQGEDATLAVGPGYNEANPMHMAALADTLNKDQAIAHGQLQPEQQGGFPAPYGQAPAYGQQQPYPMDPSQQPYGQQQQQWQDPNAQSWAPQDPNAYGQQQQQWPNGPPSYPMGSIGPVSGPHMPAAQNHFPQSNPHMQVPQSSPHLQVPQSGHMQAGYPQGGAMQPYQGQQPGVNQQSQNPFGDWNANANLGAPKKQFKLSGQVLLLAVVGTICLAIFITGIVLFATTKF